MNARHAAVWLDHQEARIFYVTADAFDEKSVHAPHHNVRHAGPTASGEPPRGNEAKRYFDEIARALGDAQEILVLGPSTAKLELVRHVHRHHAALEAKIIGVETVDHPTDGQIVAYVRRYFRAADRLRAAVDSPASH